MARQAWVLLDHLLTRFIRVRVRIEFRESGSSISTGPKKKVPAWKLMGFVQVAIDLILAILVLSILTAVPHHDYWSGYIGPVLGGKIVGVTAV